MLRDQQYFPQKNEQIRNINCAKKITNICVDNNMLSKKLRLKINNPENNKSNSLLNFSDDASVTSESENIHSKLITENHPNEL